MTNEDETVILDDYFTNIGKRWANAIDDAMIGKLSTGEAKLVTADDGESIELEWKGKRMFDKYDMSELL